MNQKGRELRRIILQQAYRAHVGHIGSAMSVADILVALYQHVIRRAPPRDPERDRFIMSKGHAALALYGILSMQGIITKEQLNQYCGEGVLLGVHPEPVLPGVDFATGSLGHGLSYGCGAALGARMQRSTRRVFVLLSDAECNEGSTWEAVMFAAHQKLANLFVIVDINGQQALGYTKEVIDLSPLNHKWHSFGWDVQEVDGHNIEVITETIEALDSEKGSPHVLLAETVFGKGVSFMERQIKWHYWPMSEAEYRQAMHEIEAT